MVTKEQVEFLSSLELRDSPIVSFYLNLDEPGVTPPQYPERADGLLRRARHGTASLPPGSELESVQADIERIGTYLRKDFSPDGLRGVAVFASKASGLWNVIPLACPITDGIFVQDRPCIRPLLQAADDAPRYAVVLVDREMGRFFLVDQNEVLDFQEIRDKASGRIPVRSRAGITDKHLERHRDEIIHHHLHHMAEILESLVQKEDVGRILIGGPPEVLADFECLLPNTVRTRVKGHIPNPPLPNRDVVLESAQPVIRDSDNAEKKQLVELAIQENASDGLAVLGLEATLSALYLKVVKTVLVERDHPSMDGFLCQECGRLFRPGETPHCPACRTADIRPVPDLIEEAIKAALAEDAEIRFVEAGLVPEWDHNLQGVAALLRFLPASVQLQ